MVFVGIITATARHFFNEKHLGRNKPGYLIVPAIATLALIFWMRPAPIEAAPAPVVSATTTTDSATAGVASGDEAIMAVVHERCTTCHAAQPTQAGFAAPPAGIILQTPEDMKIHKAKIVTAVQSGYMPLGNITKLTDEERQQLVAYTSGL